ncbi:MAG: glycosyltransferase [Candidatus Shapirobacteria bacterium]|nr:glycosyltransferase [Candidatus Shapirobacteria bacterium]
MKKVPFFSIIIPVRKSNPYLKETIKQLKKQTFKQFETLIITDKISGSANPAEKRNLGAKMAKGQYLTFLDDDSYPNKNYLKNIFKIIQKHPEYSGICGPCLTPPKDNIYQKASGLMWSSYLGSGGAGSYRNNISPSRFVDDFPSVNLTVKKKDFQTIKGFDTSYWPGEDTILCLKLTKKLHKKIFYHPSVIVYHHRRSVIIPHLQQITRYAIHRGFFAKKFPETSLKIGYIAPSLFVIYLIILTIINQINYQLIFNIPLYLYLLILIFTLFLFIFQKNKFKTSLLAMITIPLTHIYYGILFLHGFFKKDIKFKAHAFDKKTGKYIGG